MGELPLPPAELARRVGVLDQDDPVGSFDAMGAHMRQMVLNLQGSDWFSGGRRVLDFGCGSGKLLRHFVGEAEDCEFIGCDIDEPSIDWLREHFSPPLNVFVCGEKPDLALPDEHRLGVCDVGVHAFDRALGRLAAGDSSCAAARGSFYVHVSGPRDV